MTDRPGESALLLELLTWIEETTCAEISSD